MRQPDASNTGNGEAPETGKTEVEYACRKGSRRGLVAGQRDEELAGSGPAVTPGSWAATPAAIGNFRINPLNR